MLWGLGDSDRQGRSVCTGTSRCPVDRVSVLAGLAPGGTTEDTRGATLDICLEMRPEEPFIKEHKASLHIAALSFQVTEETGNVGMTWTLNLALPQLCGIWSRLPSTNHQISLSGQAQHQSTAGCGASFKPCSASS